MSYPTMPSARSHRAAGDGLRHRAPGRRVAEAALLVAIFAAPLALGTHQPGPVALMLGLSVLALAGLCVDRKAVPVPGVVMALAAVTAYVGLQCLPLPPALLRLLSPGAADLYRFSLPVSEFAGHWYPLTLDGPATALEFAKAVAYTAFFLVALALAGEAGTRKRLAAALALSGLTVALIGYGHRLVNAQQLFGMALFRDAHPPFLTTFGNANHAAGFLALCAPVSLGLALRARDRRLKFLWALAYVLTGAAVFLTLSRGGILAFLAAQAVLAFELVGTRDRRRDLDPRSPPRRRWFAVVPAAAAVVAVAAYLAYEPVMIELSTLSSVSRVSHEGKFQIFAESMKLLGEFPLTGIGRGAFATVGDRYLAALPTGTADFIENEILQPLVDLGAPMGALLLASLLVALALALRRDQRTSLDCAIWAGVFAVCLQNLVDFSLEFGGVALPLLAALALLLRTDPRAAETPRRRSRAVVLIALALCLPLSVAALIHARHGWRGETDRFAAEVSRLPDGDAAARAATPYLRRHPASFVIPLAVAQRYLAERPPRPVPALPWLNRAMYFKPRLAEPHLVTAEALADLDRKSQSLLEARLYYELSEGDTAALRRALRRFPAVTDLESAVPGTAPGLLTLSQLLGDQHRPADALQVAREAVVVDPESAAGHRRIGTLLLDAGVGPEGEAELRRAIAIEPSAPWAYLKLSEWLQQQKRQPQARELLERGLAARPASFELVLARARLELAEGRASSARAVVQGFHPIDESSETRVRLMAFQGEIFQTEGRSAQALQAYRAAAVLAPGAGFEFLTAGLLEGLSDFQAAADTLRHVAPSDPASQAHLTKRIEEDERRAEELRRSRAKSSGDLALDPLKAIDESPEVGGERARESE
jgi:tetratricopeptide (TPR) repeat protein